MKVNNCEINVVITHNVEDTMAHLYWLHWLYISLLFEAICLVMIFSPEVYCLRTIRSHLDSDNYWQINRELLHPADSNSKTAIVNIFGIHFLRRGEDEDGIVKRDLNKFTAPDRNNDGRDIDERGVRAPDSVEAETFNRNLKTLLEENQTKTLYNPKEEQQNRHNKNNEFRTNNRQQKFIDNYHALLSNNSYIDSKIHRNVVGLTDKINELATDDEVNTKDSNTNLETHSDISGNSSSSSSSDSSRYNLTGFVLNSSFDDKKKAMSGSPSALSYINVTAHSNVSGNSDSKKQNVPVVPLVAETSTNEPSQIMNDQPQEVNANRDDRILYTNTTGAEDDMVELITKNTNDLLSAEVWNITDEYNDTDPSAADGRTMPADTGFTMDAASITGISLAVVVLLGLIGTGSFVFYRRQYWNKPQTLSDKCSNADSSGYIDDSTLRENSEEMYSLDNDSFLNSLEAMTIQNYWTDNVKHTKLTNCTHCH